jgi:hypothetical protein
MHKVLPYLVVAPVVLLIAVLLKWTLVVLLGDATRVNWLSNAVLSIGALILACYITLALCYTVPTLVSGLPWLASSFGQEAKRPGLQSSLVPSGVWGHLTSARLKEEPGTRRNLRFLARLLRSDALNRRK